MAGRPDDPAGLPDKNGCPRETSLPSRNGWQLAVGGGGPDSFRMGQAHASDRVRRETYPRGNRFWQNYAECV